MTGDDDAEETATVTVEQVYVKTVESVPVSVLEDDDVEPMDYENHGDVVEYMPTMRKGDTEVVDVTPDCDGSASDES